MEVIETVAGMEGQRSRLEVSVGLVPTMGYLHEGHLSLVRRARRDCEHVTVSIFVNPTQFGPSEDFERYPRDVERDLQLLREERVDTVFTPAREEMYPPGFDEWVEVSGPVAARLEGESRPHFFRGVTTVVARLFGIVKPHRAYFGQKDAQQLRVIRRMVQDLRLGVTIVSMPIVRDTDGLALSSRNVYLSPDDRQSALALPRALTAARRLVVDKGVRDAVRVREEARKVIAADRGVEIDYVSVSDERTLEEIETIERPALLLLAARVGGTRLIDNAVLVPPGVDVPEELRDLV